MPVVGSRLGQPLPRIGLVVAAFVGILLAPNIASAETIATASTEAVFVLTGPKEQENTKIYDHPVRGLGVSPDGEHVVFTPTGAGGNEENGDIIIRDIPEEESETIYDASQQGGAGWSEFATPPMGKK